MKLLLLIFGLIVLVLVGGFAYIASVDVPIARQSVSQEIAVDLSESKAGAR